jgi:predicted dehydrogenase
MAKDPRVDAIWVCVPNDARLPVVEEIVSARNAGAELAGLACEKPLARNVAEARRMLELAGQAQLLHGYLENQVFAPSLTRAKSSSGGGRPIAGAIRARASEEHSGPHMPWFWWRARVVASQRHALSSFEATRFLLTEPGNRVTVASKVTPRSLR